MSYFKIFFYKKYLQVLEDLRTIWNWILTEKLHINPRDRGLYSAILVLGETFDNRGIFLFIQQNFSVQGGSWYKLYVLVVGTNLVCKIQKVLSIFFS
jgi:hypothetical protein